MPTSPSTIDEIYIQNFKFFPKLNEPIKLDGKHWLLYGENGSGKSSIYWALYTLLECANKEDVGEIQKYFDPLSPERLTNIHYSLPAWIDPYIQLKLKDGTEFKVSFNDIGINEDVEVKESNYSSNFLNYRNLLSIYNAAHSLEINVFNYFEYSVLPYIKFTPVTYWHTFPDNSVDQLTTVSANQIWEFVKQGPQKNLRNALGNDRYPREGEVQYTEYNTIVSGFKAEMETLLTYINTEGNPILKDELGYDLTFKLELSNKEYFRDRRRVRSKMFKLTQQQFERPQFYIKLTVPEYEGTHDSVYRPHSFLNEAKLTAIGLAIRLAVLKKSFSDNAKLKILVLDDLLISLDMSNREKVMDIILKNYIDEYQIFIFTHDKIMFEDALRHIEIFHREEGRRNGITEEELLKNLYKTKWCINEMYQAINENIPHPYLVPSFSPISKAQFYFKEQVDYNACGNNLRAALEDFFISFLPDALRNNQTMLNGLVVQARTYFQYVGFSTILLDKIERYLKRSLNPTSHYNPRANYYRKELEDVFKIHNELLKLKNKPLIAVNEKIKFSISTVEGTTYTYTAQLMDDIKFYNKADGTNNFIVHADKRVCVITGITTDSITNLVGNRTNDFTLQELYDDTCQGIIRHLHQTPIIIANMEQVYSDIYGNTIEQLLQTLY